jgi:hypothetical protein
MLLTPALLAVTGCLCLSIALIEAWCLTAVRYIGIAALKRLFPGDQHLLRSHIDFLLMSGLLFVFYLLFAHLSLVPSRVVLVAMCIGSITNPLGFLALAVSPGLPRTPRSAFGMIMSASFIVTTVGYLGAAWHVGRAALAVMGTN